MAFVIMQSCCNDASCVAVCPVNCIHPSPGEPGFATAEMLHIDPDGCIDCGACLDACPVDAIASDEDVPRAMLPFVEINARYYDDPEHRDYPPTPTRRPAVAPIPGDDALRVAIIGSGPAAVYAAGELLQYRGTPFRVDVFEKLVAPGGLVRYGVAPDHQSTKLVGDRLLATLAHPGCRVFLSVDVGTDITREQLLDRYHVVLYATGASKGRALRIPGEELHGVTSAADFVRWYNAHPDAAEPGFDLDAERAVIVGNGNVALDVARMLLSSAESLARTDIADRALSALRASRIREAVVIGRRGIADAAFSTPELVGLAAVTDFDVIVEGQLPELDEAAFDSEGASQRERVRALRTLLAQPTGRDRRLIFRFDQTPTRIVGDERVNAVECTRRLDGQQTELVECGLVIAAIGFLGTEMRGVPFDPLKGVVWNTGGRVVDPASSNAIVGEYVTGWIKRGPSGVIGTNRRCASETVSAIAEDAKEGRVLRPALTADDVPDIVGKHLTLADWRVIDRLERLRGKEAGRPRVKFEQASDVFEAL